MRRLWIVVMTTVLAGIASPGAFGQQAPRPAARPAPTVDPGKEGWALYKAGRLAEAEPLLQKALNAAEQGRAPDDPKLAPALTRLGLLHLARARYDDADGLLQRSLAIRERAFGPEHEEVATGLSDLARLYREQGRYGEVEPLLVRALAIRERTLGPESAEVGSVINSLGWLYQATGRYSDAEAAYRRALTINEQVFGPDHAELAAALGNLGKLYAQQGRFAEGERAFVRAAAIAENHARGRDTRFLATILDNLGRLYRTEDRYLEAEPLLQRALALREEVYGRDHPETGAVAYDLGELYLQLRRDQEALTLARRSLTIAERAFGPEHRRVASSLALLAGLHDAQGRHEEAERLLAQALQIRQQKLGAEHPATAINLAAIARVQANAGRLENAMTSIRRAAAIQERRIAAATASLAVDVTDEPFGRRVIFPRLVRIGWRLVEKAAVSERQALIDETLHAGQLTQTAGAAAAVVRMAARFATSEDTLGKLVRQRQDAFGRWRAVEIAAVDAIGRGGGGNLRKRLAESVAELAALDANLLRTFPEYAELTSPAPAKLIEIQTLLRPGELLVTYAALKANEEQRESEATYLWAIRRDRAEMYKLDLAPGELAASVRRLRDQLDPARWSDGSPPPYDTALAHDLLRKLLPLDEPMLAGIDHLLIVPHGPLESLPFSALVRTPLAPSAPVDWLARSLATTTLPSVSSLRALRRFAGMSRAAEPFKGIGDPVLDGPPGPARGVSLAGSFTARGLADPRSLRAMPPLPESAAELRALAASLGAGETSILLGSAATERAVKAGRLAGARVVAFATHAGIAGELPGLAEPALVLTPPETASEEDDGLLTASEAARLDLDADLVLLSACNTAAPDGTPGAPGLSGLAKAFVYAGARSLLVSHWSVISDAAERLTTGMFAEIARDPGIGRAEALRRSEMAMLDDPERPDLAHPAAWAPFVLVGEGGRSDASGTRSQLVDKGPPPHEDHAPTAATWP